MLTGWVVMRPERVIDPATQLPALALPGLAAATLGLSRSGGQPRAPRLCRRNRTRPRDGGVARWAHPVGTSRAGRPWRRGSGPGGPWLRQNLHHLAGESRSSPASSRCIASIGARSSPAVAGECCSLNRSRSGRMVFSGVAAAAVHQGASCQSRCDDRAIGCQVEARRGHRSHVRCRGSRADGMDVVACRRRRLRRPAAAPRVWLPTSRSATILPMSSCGPALLSAPNAVRVEVDKPKTGVAGLAIDFSPPANTTVPAVTLNVPLTTSGVAVLPIEQGIPLGSPGVWIW